MTHLNFMKYPKIHAIYKDREVGEIYRNPEDIIVVEEKLDGSNFRFIINNNTVTFGSRNLELGTESSKQFTECIEYLYNILKSKKLKNYHGKIFYGEYVSQRNRHTLNYDWKSVPIFSGYDVYDVVNGYWFDHESAKQAFEDLGLAFVPIVEIGKVKDLGRDTELSPHFNNLQQRISKIVSSYDALWKKRTDLILNQK